MPGAWMYHYNRGVMLALTGRRGEAIASYERALAIHPQAVNARNNVGNLYQSEGRLSEAQACFEEVLRARPDYALAENNLGLVQFALGHLDEGLASLRRALKLNPDYEQAYRNILLAMNAHEGFDRAALLAEHREFARRYVDLIPAMKALRRVRGEHDRLRVGYVSSDFRSHSVAFFLEKILANHDRSRFEITCYSNVVQPDLMTQRMRGYAQQWRDIWNISDEAAAKLIQQDQIDVLVELGGHTERSRLLVAAWRAAPVQVSYLGYPGTTGVSQVDYLIADSHIAPAGAEMFYTEKVVRLPGSFFCYFGPELGVSVAPAPAASRGYVTFGVLTNWLKARPMMLRLWAQIVQQVENSRLLLKATSFRDARLVEDVKAFFVREGVAAERITIQGYSDFPSYLRLLGEVDIGLDTFPFNGHTTTCHQLWMGVPVVTLAGETHASRMGLSVLSGLGLEELAAKSAEEYVEIAVRLAGDLDRMQSLRAGMRDAGTDRGCWMGGGSRGSWSGLMRACGRIQPQGSPGDGSAGARLDLRLC